VDYLITVVFPDLSERAQQLGLEFFDMDLRRGVPAKDATGETANSWEYCRQWIDRVEPFFVCILGQRKLSNTLRQYLLEIREQPRGLLDDIETLVLGRVDPDGCGRA